MKRAVMVVTAVVMLFSMVGAVGLSDIVGHWAEGDISVLVDKGIIKGLSETEYGPNQNMTRAQFVAIMNRAFPDATRETGAVFDDVNETDWFYSDVMKGLVNGTGDGKFGPDLPISRQDACVLVVRYMGGEATDEPNILDYDAVSDYAKEAVAIVIGSGIVGGYPDGTFRPNGNITRAEVASIINRAISGGKSEAVEPEKPAEPWIELVEFKYYGEKITHEFKSEEFIDKVDGANVLQKMTLRLQEKLVLWNPKEPKHTTSSEAMQKLIDGEKDIIFVPYPSKGDFEKAKAAGVQLEGAPIAKDAIVFVANGNGEITSLTLEQIRKIYSEEIKKWEELSISSRVPPGKITAYSTSIDTESGASFRKFMGDVPLKKSETVWSIPGTSDISDVRYVLDAAIRQDLGGIGYTYYFHYKENTLQCLAIDDINPMPKAIREGEYPFALDYYAIIRKDSPKGSFERELLNYMLSPVGQTLIHNAGYIEL